LKFNQPTTLNNIKLQIWTSRLLGWCGLKFIYDRWLSMGGTMTNACSAKLNGIGSTGILTNTWISTTWYWQNVNIMAAVKWVHEIIICILKKWLYIMLFMLICKITNGDTYHTVNKDSTVVIAFLVRNKAHTLPYFLTLLERLDYPKDRISLW
jgi:hypothetical protein